MEISFYNQWVENNQPFADGVEFYSKHGTNTTLKRLFASGENSFTRNKLEDEIYSLRHIFIPIAKPTNRAKTKIDRSKLPPHLQAEYDKLQGLIGRMSYLHAQLEVVPMDEQRFSLAEEIMDAASERRAIFKNIDHFVETGKELVQVVIEKPKTQEKELVVLQLQDELRRLRVQRSKLKTNKKRIEDYNSVIARITEIEGRLNDAI
jgi:replicative DNA helicase